MSDAGIRRDGKSEYKLYPRIGFVFGIYPLTLLAQKLPVSKACALIVSVD